MLGKVLLGKVLLEMLLQLIVCLSQPFQSPFQSVSSVDNRLGAVTFGPWPLRQ